MSENKPDLMAELADKWDAMAADARKKGEHGMSNAYEDCAEELRAHHAELEAVVRDAARYRWLRDSGNAELYVHNIPGIDNCKQTGGDGLEEGLDQAMHNSAREGL